MSPECDLALHFQRAVSIPRLSMYTETHDVDLLPAICRYMWNASLCEALYPQVHGVEIALKNLIDGHMLGAIGPHWYDTAGILLDPHQVAAVADARAQLVRKGRADTHDAIVSELSFGFWTAMLAGHYARPIWGPGFATCFTSLPADLNSRGALLDRLQKIRILRNSVSHHESIWQRNLYAEHRRIKQALQGLSPAVHEMICIVDRFPAVLAAGPLVNKAAIDALGATWVP